jgi:hypothetical protein
VANLARVGDGGEGNRQSEDDFKVYPEHREWSCDCGHFL